VKKILIITVVILLASTALFALLVYLGAELYMRDVTTELSWVENVKSTNQLIKHPIDAWGNKYRFEKRQFGSDNYILYWSPGEDHVFSTIQITLTDFFNYSDVGDDIIHIFNIERDGSIEYSITIPEIYGIPKGNLSY